MGWKLGRFRQLRNRLSTENKASMFTAKHGVGAYAVNFEACTLRDKKASSNPMNLRIRTV